jgi:aminoglycoside phosphotransferase (APT) family kinase protein
VGPAVDALAECLSDDVAVPRFLAYVPALRLSLLDELPGDRKPAHEVVDDAALVVAALHRSEIALGAPRPVAAELAEIDDLVLLVERVAPSTGTVLHTLATAITAAAAETEPLALVFSHGDFTPAQLLAGGARRGLVDFDTIAQAEPALDLGRFLAYLRLAMAKAQPPADREAADRLADRFLATYVDAVSGGTDAVELRARVHVYEALSLMRITVHAWQQLKPGRVRTAFPILCEEVASL